MPEPINHPTRLTKTMPTVQKRLEQELQSFTKNFPLWHHTVGQKIRYTLVPPTTPWNPEQAYAFNAKAGIQHKSRAIQVQLSPVNLVSDSSADAQHAYTRAQLQAAAFGLGLRLSRDPQLHAFAINLHRSRNEPSLQETWAQVLQENPHAQALQQALALWEKFLAKVAPENTPLCPGLGPVKATATNDPLWKKACIPPHLLQGTDACGTSKLHDAHLLTREDLTYLADDAVKGMPFLASRRPLVAPPAVRKVSEKRLLSQDLEQHDALLNEIQVDLRLLGLEDHDYQLYHGPRKILRTGKLLSCLLTGEDADVYIALDLGPIANAPAKVQATPQTKAHERLPRRHIEVYACKGLSAEASLSLLQNVFSISASPECPPIFVLTDGKGEIQALPVACNANSLTALQHSTNARPALAQSSSSNTKHARAAPLARTAPKPQAMYLGL